MMETARSAASRHPRRTATVLAAVVALVLGIVLVKALSPPGAPVRPDDLAQLADPPVGPDGVPVGPVVTTLPEYCAVPAATVARLVPDAETWKDGGQGECKWTSRPGDRESWRTLTVGIDLYRGAAAQHWVPETGRSPVGAAMKAVPSPFPDEPAKVVTGLGDEATVQVPDDATVVARVGNAVVTVHYGDGGGGMPEKTAREGAFTAASETLAGLGARTPPRPAIATPPQPTPARTFPDFCAAVSQRTVDLLVHGAGTGRPTLEGDSLGIRDARSGGCFWGSAERHLMISAAAVPGTKLSDGTRLATREYVLRHVDARAEKTLSVHDKKYFHAVPGLGDQAFAAHVPGVVPDQVLFRAGNVLVRVTYESADEREPLGRKTALRGAYAVAKEVARAL